MPAKLWHPQTAFTSGVMAPGMASREDTSFYGSGVEIGLNNIPRLEGPADRRWGLRHRDFLTGMARLMEFEFKRDQLYLFCFGHQRVDIYYADTMTKATELTSCQWTLAMLPRLNVAVLGDTMIVCHPDMKTQVLKRTGAAIFTKADLTFEEHSSGAPRYQPYYRFAAPGITLTPSATTGSITLTASASHFVAGHVGCIMRMTHDNGTGDPEKPKEVLITAVTNGTTASATVRQTLDDTAATATWDEQVFSDLRGYFNTVAFHDNRTVFGGHKSLQSYMFVSKAFAPYNFDLGTTQDNEAIWQDIGDDQVAEILGIVSYRHLQVFTDSGPYIVPGSDTKAITPKTWSMKRQVPYASGFVKPRAFDGATLFIQDSGAMVRELLWNDVQQAYDGPPASFLASHLIKAPVDLAVLDGADGRPEQYAIIVNGDGTAAVYTSLRDQKVRGWWPWETDGDFKAAAVVGRKMVALVERVIDSVTKWCLEEFDPDLALDCAKTATGSAATVWAGFSHLAGAEVSVLSNNYSLGRFTVAEDGSITLPYEVTAVEVGLYFERLLQPMPPMPALPDGSARGRMVRLIRTVATVSNALGFRVNGRPSAVRFAGEDFNQPPTPQTGELEFRNLGFSKRVAPLLDWPEPVRCTVHGLALELKVNR